MTVIQIDDPADPRLADYRDLRDVQLRQTLEVEHAPQITATLLAGGRAPATPVAVVMDGTMPAERTVLSTLGELPDDHVAQAVKPPAIIVIGGVVAVAHPERYAVPETEPVTVPSTTHDG